MKSKSRGGVQKTIIVKTTQKALWSMGKKKILIGKREYDVGLADYSIEGLEEEIQIERKSLDDLYGTLSGRWDRFEAELARLNQCKFAAVIVEAGWDRISIGVPTSRMKPGSVVGGILAWQQRYPNVHWLTAPSRGAAEKFTYRVLERYWNDRQKRGSNVEVV